MPERKVFFSIDVFPYHHHHHEQSLLWWQPFISVIRITIVIIIQTNSENSVVCKWITHSNVEPCMERFPIIARNLWRIFELVLPNLQPSVKRVSQVKFATTTKIGSLHWVFDQLSTEVRCKAVRPGRNANKGKSLLRLWFKIPYLCILSTSNSPGSTAKAKSTKHCQERDVIYYTSLPSDVLLFFGWSQFYCFSVLRQPKTKLKVISKESQI